MSDDDATPTLNLSERVGLRDVYRAVGESEARIKEHISLIMLPISAALADHELRLRDIEREGSKEARDALAATVVLDSRVASVERAVNAGVERRSGAFATLSAQRTFILLLLSVGSFSLAVAAFVRS